MAAYFVRSAAAGSGTGANWTNAFTTLSAALAAGAAGDTFWLADDHAETQASSLTLASPGTTASPCFIYSVDHTVGSPGTSDIKSDPYTVSSPACATINTTGNSPIALTGIAYCQGVVFNAGSGAVAAGITNNGTWRLADCSLRKNGTTVSTSAISLGADPQELDNVTFAFGNTGDRLFANSNLIWRNTNAGAAIIGATIPATLIRNTSGNTLSIEEVDLSSVSGTLITNATGRCTYNLDRCKLHSSAVLSAALTIRGTRINILNCGSSGGDNNRYELMDYAGSFVTETAIVRTGGASDSNTSGVPFSFSISTTANAKWTFPLVLWTMGVWNQTLSADATVTVYGIGNAATIPNNDDIWIRASYFGASGSPLGSVKHSTKANNLATGSALTADTSAWDSLVTARANSTVYSIGQVRKVASNAGRVFFCTANGTSASSEPGGYATAVDGGSVTDGTATFRAGVRFRMAVTLTSPQPALRGNIKVDVLVGKASSAYIVDPDPVLT